MIASSCFNVLAYPPEIFLVDGRYSRTNKIKILYIVTCDNIKAMLKCVVLININHIFMN